MVEVEKSNESNESNEYPCVVNKRTGKVYGGEKGVIVEVLHEKGMVRIIKELGLVPLENSIIYQGNSRRHDVRLVPEFKP